MDSKEIMVGDWLLWDNTLPCIVTTISCDYIETTKCGITLAESHFLQGVPLTPEILEKNGFTGGEYKSWTGDVWYLEEEGFRKIGLTMSRKESTLWGEKIKPLSPDSIGYNFAVPNIKFVHQLQHALRLCGINKEIKL